MEKLRRNRWRRAVDGTKVINKKLLIAILHVNDLFVSPRDISRSNFYTTPFDPVELELEGTLLSLCPFQTLDISL
jgi:hypothetical protein